MPDMADPADQAGRRSSRAKRPAEWLAVLPSSFGTMIPTTLILGVLLTTQTPRAGRPYRIEYTIAMPDVAAHLYSITLTASGAAGAVDLQMPVWSPGRYGRMDFAKNVQDFSVSGGEGEPL